MKKFKQYKNICRAAALAMIMQSSIGISYANPNEPASDVYTKTQGINQSPTQTIKISGLVTDSDGNPIIGATVAVKGTTNGTMTDVDGRYSLTVQKGDIVTYTYVGFNQEEKEVGNDTTINIRLLTSDVNLDDIVVIGYGQQKKSSVVSSINSITSKELQVTGRSLNNSIAGQISGVIAVQRSGEPGWDDAEFWIRGVSSYAGGTSPLVLVDGVPRQMSNISVDEIETFTVLKDAAATAVYGAEGANGVVLITSKRGKREKTQISFKTEHSIVTPTRLPKILDSYRYLSLYNEAKWNEEYNPMTGFVPQYSDEVLDKYRSGADSDLYPNVNWLDLLKKNSYNGRYTLSVRGGGERVRYFVSGGFYNEDGIYKSETIENYDANLGYKRYNLRSNIDMDITKTTKLAVDLSGIYVQSNAPSSTASTLWSAFTLFPVHIVPMKYSDGTNSDHYFADTDRYNPYNLLNLRGYTKNWEATAQSKVSVEQRLDVLTEGLYARANISFDSFTQSRTDRTKRPHTYYASGRDTNGDLIKKTIAEGSALGNPSTSASGGHKKIYIEGSLNYDRTFVDKHAVTGMILYNQKEEQFQNNSGLNCLPFRKQSIVARGTYNFDNRYMLEASFGMTGSENFSKGHRWGIFPAIGGAWFISHENFMKPVEDYLSTLKVRASYGITGNDNLPTDLARFPYRASLNQDNSGYNMGISPGAAGSATNWIGNGITENTFAAPTLSWEVEKKFNLGLDFGLFRGRIEGSVDYFHNKRSDILINRQTVPSASGFRNNPMENMGITKNSGIDGNLIAKQNLGEFTLTGRFNFTYAKNKIVEYDEIPQRYAYQQYTGNSINQPRLYIAERLYTPDDFNITTNANGSKNYTLKDGLANPNSPVAPGDIKYSDLNGDGVIDSYDETYKHGFYPNNPNMVYGIGINLDYKGFYAGVFLQGAAQASVNLIASPKNFVPFYNGVDYSSGRNFAMDRWTAEDPYNQDVLFPRLRTTNNSHNLKQSTWWYRKGDFVRLKNIEFGYQFNKKTISKYYMENLRIYVQGSNIAVWDNVKYWDPEQGNANSGASYPISGTWTIGLEVTF
ncbi:TonB-linked SusC/RagA family outer membrane protein [Dysgonomonas sp. PFB1-18]|uniref:SusC/RagA family TonB-linked outer membrane protein n=1 Tax=unclassified Dysgonomonas TaxID=2630389 RepID=UPI00247535FB|nr:MULTISPECIES: TonB-dependent receptor [unclassified Dysgonomonas]MDH6310524.1 TonB-linked SusC/RagA family outer membrane protein [Dysgonomonas sp. PF1-14]MDH6340374.1 TonB-linked SusC/RagA family outer membrane protein [Dysgonomonas sp. PF1-16]MDH6382046.1 TonB-linked SusC/RagA family outer membrane protein [Dysgonomonas sp. PFB1-18]MDH6399345.1 TonB-linked SusC/RagA family outer membrane protein [Dysgonomonas sp. PF1-23]